ncbi:RiPP maturation radical SAM C-methyltransferase [Actinophytocola xanthii]|uniref:B12-binding domain-containing radical SAM protein n=1 Tax=Actinophytocola xanthii TaxID=1912961 RepID=A0A1Q8CK96_9PSEU|nr:RiPP maturation radical SAM C-methyltransferase [Actinophytocola xanthii]OLF14753.1 B12-binding domain-containing radical SAM protein [Actinophytocola xanthii]
MLSTPEQRHDCPVVLVSMPFMEVYRPSIQLGLLKAIGVTSGFPVHTLHANLDFAARIGVEHYRLLTEQRGQQLGDWLFSLAAFGDLAPDPGSYWVDGFARRLATTGRPQAELREWLLRIRNVEVPAYLDSLLDPVLRHKPRLVGFTSTFQQNAASFALARRIKSRYPEITMVFGGANFDGEMGVEHVRAVDVVDVAVIGEGDVAFPMLLDAVAAGADPGSVPGTASRADDGVRRTAPRPLSHKLDELPVPDYDEYFERAERLDLLDRTDRPEIWLPFESARGCWWGEKHHCTFCGLNGTSMRFRSKSAQRVFDELAHQARRYGGFRFAAVDNILDLAYLRTLIPMLLGTDYELFYEVKANLTRAQVRLLAQGGVRRLQPGLESLSSHVLQLMRKGVTAGQNVNLLRWARYYGIHVQWNLLWGFPGETEQDYAEQAAVLPHLVHLQPPEGATRVWLERFSPLFTEPDLMAVRSRAPEATYRAVYPKDVDLDRVAYFFEYTQADQLPDRVYDQLAHAAAQWMEAEPANLTYRSAPGLLQIEDTRPGRAGVYRFEDTIADIYVACSERPLSARAVRDKLRLTTEEPTIQAVFDEFAQRGLMFLDGRRALALALPAVPGR